MQTYSSFCITYLHVHVICLGADNLFGAFVHFIFPSSSVGLCHERGFLLQEPLPVHFDDLPGCRSLTGWQQESLCKTN